MNAEKFSPFCPDPVALRFNKSRFAVVQKPQSLLLLNRVHKSLIHDSLRPPTLRSEYSIRFAPEKADVAPSNQLAVSCCTNPADLLMRVMGLDVSRTSGEIAQLEDGQVHPGGRVTLQHEPLQQLARGFRPSDEVVLGATDNTTAIVTALKPHVATVAIANPVQVRLIAEARVKTDKIDAAILVQLYWTSDWQSGSACGNLTASARTSTRSTGFSASLSSMTIG